MDALGLQDGVVAVAEQFLAGGLGVCAAGEGANLDVEQTVCDVMVDGDGVASLAKGADQNVGVVRVFDGGNLHAPRGGRLGGDGQSGTN